MSEKKTIDEMRDEIQIEAKVLDQEALVQMYQSWFGDRWKWNAEDDTATNIEGEPIPDDVELKFTSIRDLLPKREPQ